MNLLSVLFPLFRYLLVAILGFELRALPLGTPPLDLGPRSFCSGYFGSRCLLFVQACLNDDLPIFTSCLSGMAGAPHNTQLCID
jgi:hypothetical protein